ncbi:hypothetical protein ACWZHB_32410 [Nocardia sp. FBN12]|uniref:hypothetical protein n=1 Tax=Nocardia sp. FBN12 TaxID=3419766 RepID=UPI003D04A53F
MTHVSREDGDRHGAEVFDPGRVAEQFGEIEKWLRGNLATVAIGGALLSDDASEATSSNRCQAH